ncbi:alanine racemase [Cytobacillus sp. IB215665]|uniref:alanine racemase n=1 Tax=Cytobacillus sp. IB215665 TaxID=3097357 RepID=UPI002A14E4F2|nr:alanine racemase [Cytobacillus sp. IB215665]MDX8367390.1 alanine racemase [Cytobacillus sp. IB215665]
MSTFHRDTWVEINLDHIHDNVQAMRNHIADDVQIIAVVKANAYGHGYTQVARTALEAGATMLAVAFMDEAIFLRKHGIQAPILVMGATRPEDLSDAIKFNVIITIFQADWLHEALKSYHEDQAIHLHVKLDTGMGRLGVRTEAELKEIETVVNNDKRLVLHGVYTHFATADEINTTYLEQQYSLFQQMLDWFVEKPSMIHCANSAAALRFPHQLFNAIRFGISMYGLTPSVDIKPQLPFPLKEAFSLHSRLSHIKLVSPGNSVSYGATYTTKQEEWIGTVPIGYADGWLRKLRNNEVLVNGERIPIVGTICMDQMMVKLDNEVPVGTQVTLIGQQLNNFIQVDEIAEQLDTINYEVTCMINYRVPRLYIRNNSVIEVVNHLK